MEETTPALVPEAVTAQAPVTSPEAPQAPAMARSPRGTTPLEWVAWFLVSPFSRLVLLGGLFVLLEVFVANPLTKTGFLEGFYRQEIFQATAVLVLLLSVGFLIERRGPAALGLPLRGMLRDTFAGFGLGVFLISGVIAGLSACGWYRIESVSDRPLEVIPAIGFFYIAAAFEEILFRGMLFRIIEEGMGSWIALAVSSAFFGFAHLGNPNATASSALAIVLEAGVLLGACYMLRRSLWYVTALHAAWNFTQGTIFGAAVSGTDAGGVPVLFTSTTDGPAAWTGGAFGPEGGLVAVILCTAAGVIALGLAIHHRRLVTPVWMRRLRRRLFAPVGASSQCAE